MKERYKRPFLVRLLNLFLFPKEYSYEYLSKWYTKKFKIDLPEKVQKYLKLLMDEVYTHNEFDPLGKVLFNFFIFQNLKNLAFIEKRGKIKSIKAIYIISLPRTASTFFHKYLGSDPQFKTLSFWELNEIGRYNFSKVRKTLGKVMLSFHHYLTPEIKYIHNVENEGPEECSKILLTSFITQIYPLMFKLPNYEIELQKENFDYTYELYFKALSLIKENEKPMLLKAPMHLQAIDQIRKYTPEAPILFLHREIQSVLSSAISLAKTYAYLFTPKIDDDDLINRIYQRLSHDINKALDNCDNDRLVYHIQYTNLMKNKNAILENIEKRFNLNLTPQSQTKRSLYKKHNYPLIETIPKEFINYQNFVKNLEDNVDQP